MEVVRIVEDTVAYKFPCANANNCKFVYSLTYKFILFGQCSVKRHWLLAPESTKGAKNNHSKQKQMKVLHTPHMQAILNNLHSY